MTDRNGEEGGLLDRLRGGDHGALGALFDLHRERLSQIIYFRLDVRLRPRIDVEDVLQESYLDAARRIPHYFENPPSSFFVWVRTIVQQTMIDLHRRHLGAQRRNAVREVVIRADGRDQTSSVSLANHVVEDLTTVSEAAMRAELVDQVEQAIESMDSIDREVLVLRHFEELTNGEAAEVLGVTPAAASMRYTRAISKLQQLLAELPGVYPDENSSRSNDDARKVG